MQKIKQNTGAIILGLFMFSIGFWWQVLPIEKSLILLFILSIVRFSGIFLVFYGFYKLFYKNRLSASQNSPKVKYSLIFIVSGLAFIVGGFLLGNLSCTKNFICGVAYAFILLFFFVPLGLIFLTIGLVKFFRYTRTKTQYLKNNK